MKFICVLTTAPSQAVARKLAQALLSRRLAACVQLIPRVESHYIWKGKREKSAEILLMIKTRAPLYKKVETFLSKNHPYDVPEIVALPIVKGSASYLNWMLKS